jgi:hypothetical protein
MSFHNGGFIDENEPRQKPFDEEVVEPSAMESEYYMDGKVKVGAKPKGNKNGKKGKKSKKSNDDANYCAYFCGLLRSK